MITKKKKKKKKVSTYQDPRSIYRVRWKLIQGPEVKSSEGYINIPANDEQDAIDRFRTSYNIAGRKFKVISVTEKPMPK